MRSRNTARAVLLALLTPLALAAHEVMVFSFVTAAGREIAAPNLQYPAPCLLASAGEREIGAVTNESKRASAETVRAALDRALRVNHYQSASEAVPPADSLIVVYHWGCAAPVMVDAGESREEFFNRDAMFAVIGGRALDSALFSERAAILAAAREERYFVIVSAYRRGGERTLLWRTHMTTPSLGLTEARAVPILLAAGAALFGRETPQLRQIAIDVEGVLSAEAGGH